MNFFTYKAKKDKERAIRNREIISDFSTLLRAWLRVKQTLRVDKFDLYPSLAMAKRNFQNLVGIKQARRRVKCDKEIAKIDKITEDAIGGSYHYMRK